jgi:phospholipid/cholesterol/gamma-HCH transport system permease protein
VSALNSILQEVGSLAIFLREVARAALHTRGNFKPIMAQTASISIRSLPTVAFAGVFVGAILVLQFNQILVQYDAQMFLGGLNTSSVVREVGPLIISFLLAGKIGAYTAAELATMRVTEQIDAIQCLGTNPIQYLIVPRFIGIVISSLILLMLGLLISIAGAMFVASTLCGVNWLQFAQSIPRFTDGFTVAGGMIKALVYGTIVAAVACHRGYRASGGARGVGQAVTLAAVYTNLYIVVANFAVSHVLDFLSELGRSWLGGVGA